MNCAKIGSCEYWKFKDMASVTFQMRMLLVLLAAIALFQVPQVLSSRVFDADHYYNSPSRPSGDLGFLRKDHPVNMTLTTKLRRVRRPTSSLSPREVFLEGLASSVERASGLAFRNKRGFSSLDTRSSVFLKPNGHEMEVQFGSPPQASLVLLVDTGSSLTWTQCSPCPNCPQQFEPLFDPSASTSYQRVACSDNMCNYLETGDPTTGGTCANTCHYGVSYGGGGSSQGEFAQERLTLAGGGNYVPSVFMGCGYDNNGILGYDGILALDSSSLSFASQLGQFSICLLPLFYDETKSTPIVFGDPTLPGDGSPGSTPIFPNPITHLPYYYVQVVYLSVNSEFVYLPRDALLIDGNGGGGIILDTGTTYSVLHDIVFDALVAQLMIANYTALREGNSPCWPLAPGGFESMQNLPFIELFMSGDSTMGIATEGTYQVVGNKVCLAIARSTDTNLPMIIGDYQMINQYMIFNPQKRELQFSIYDCTKQAS